jgi:hypothetical protein
MSGFELAMVADLADLGGWVLRILTVIWGS